MGLLYTEALFVSGWLLSYVVVIWLLGSCGFLVFVIAILLYLGWFCS